MGSGKPAEPTPRDTGMLRYAPNPTMDRGMERSPDNIPKAPLSQVPEENLLPERPDFFQRHFDMSRGGWAEGGDVDEGESWSPPVEQDIQKPEPSPLTKVDAIRAALRTATAKNPPLESLPDGQQSLTASPPPTGRESLARTLMGDDPSNTRRRLISDTLGTTGIGEQHAGLADFTPIGQAMGVQEELQRGDPQQAALWAMPGAAELKGAARPFMSEAKSLLGKLALQSKDVTHTPLDVSGFETIGGQEGTQPAKQMLDPKTGDKWYVKQAPSQDQANNEKLTAELYKAAGTPVADVRLTTVNGKPGIASKMIEGKQLSDVTTPYNQIDGLHENFPVDAWLANHDAVGTGPENPLGNIIVDKGGLAHRIDTGGGLLYKGTGGLKPNGFPVGLTELQTMRDPIYSPLSSEVFAGPITEAATDGAYRLSKVSSDKIHDLVMKYGPGGLDEKAELYHNLIMRKKQIEDHYGIGESTPSDGTPPTGSSAEELENLIAQQKDDEAEYWNSIEKQAQHEYGLGQGIHDEDEGWLKRITKNLKPMDWKSYKPPEAKNLTPVETPHAPPEGVDALGFNRSVPLLHGSRTSRGPFAQLKDPASFKGTEQAMFAAHDDSIARAYTHSLGDEFVHKFLARPEKAASVDWPTITGGYHGYEPEAMHQLINAARKQGHDLIAIHNIDDIAGGIQTQYAILNPEILRYPTAKFDSTKLHLRTPLAGLVGGGLFAYGTLKGQSKEGQMKRGGATKTALRTAKKYAAGGGMDSWMMHQASRNLHQEGMIKSPVPGRTDKLPMNVPSGSYVLPADIPSALGQGNSMAGGAILRKMFNSGPGGMPLQKIGGGRPMMPHLNMQPQRMPKNPMGFDGGGVIPSFSGANPPPPPPPELADGGNAGTVPIIAAGGEYIIHPDVVKDIGHGSINAGHRSLDKFVLLVRKEHIKTLGKLKPPKR